MRLLEHTHESLTERLAEGYGKGAFHARALMHECYARCNPWAFEAAELDPSPAFRRRLQQDWAFSPGSVVDEVVSEGVIKFVTRLDDGAAIESVVLPMASHCTVCISSQVGCRMGCKFCKTARMGLVRQLRVEEIVGQVYAARRRYGPRVRNVVFMGMGEPFDNFDAVIQAIRVINDQRGLDVALKYITISTCGHVNGIGKLARLALPRLRLAISLNAATDDLRSRLMPINRSAPLARLKQALQAFPMGPKDSALMMAYVLLPGVNDHPCHARQVADFFHSLNARINLIPFNPCTGADMGFRAPTEMEIDRFIQRLNQQGVFTCRRSTKGREAMAACGQLGRG